MKYISTLCVIGIILFASGCQQAQQTSQNSSTIDRKSRLMAAENISIKDELAKNKRELDKQNKLLAQLQQDNEKMKKLASINEIQLDSLKKTLSGSSQVLADLRKQLEECQGMVEAKGAPELCKYKLEQQKKLLTECEKAKQELETAGDTNAEFLLSKLPDDLMKQVEACTEENKKLTEKIAELEKSAGKSSQ
jgi:DNA repair exonuclease SbcCD ATPase subunit